MLGYDWKQIYESPRAIEKDLGGFKFKGVGWYETKTDTLLVRALGQRLIVTCWNQPDGLQQMIEELAEMMKLDVFNAKSKVVQMKTQKR